MPILLHASVSPHSHYSLTQVQQGMARNKLHCESKSRWGNPDCGKWLQHTAWPAARHIMFTEDDTDFCNFLQTFSTITGETGNTSCNQIALFHVFPLFSLFYISPCIICHWITTGYDTLEPASFWWSPSWATSHKGTHNHSHHYRTTCKQWYYHLLLMKMFCLLLLAIFVDNFTH